VFLQHHGKGVKHNLFWKKHGKTLKITRSKTPLAPRNNRIIAVKSGLAMPFYVRVQSPIGINAPIGSK